MNAWDEAATRFVRSQAARGGTLSRIVQIVPDAFSAFSEYLALGADPAARAAAYRALFADALPDELVTEIRCHLQQQKVLGSDRFHAWVEARTGRFAGCARLAVRPVAQIVLTPWGRLFAAGFAVV